MASSVDISSRDLLRSVRGARQRVPSLMLDDERRHSQHRRVALSSQRQQPDRPSSSRNPHQKLHNVLSEILCAQSAQKQHCRPTLQQNPPSTIPKQPCKTATFPAQSAPTSLRASAMALHSRLSPQQRLRLHTSQRVRELAIRRPSPDRYVHHILSASSVNNRSPSPQPQTSASPPSTRQASFQAQSTSP
jgi:hypothetical protein